MIPDLEAVIGNYLRADAGVSAIVGDRVVGEPPGSHGLPWAMVALLDAPAFAEDPADHAIEALLQIDCYAGTGRKGEASRLARAVRAALADIADHEHVGATISGARISSRWLPDTAFEPVRARYIVTATVWAHEVPA